MIDSEAMENFTSAGGKVRGQVSAIGRGGYCIAVSKEFLCEVLPKPVKVSGKTDVRTPIEKLTASQQSIPYPGQIEAPLRRGHSASP